MAPIDESGRERGGRPRGQRLIGGALGLGVAVLLIASAPASPHQHEIRDVRNHILESFAFLPVHVNDSTTVVRVERYWDDEIRVHLESGHTLRVTVELDSY